MGWLLVFGLILILGGCADQQLQSAQKLQSAKTPPLPVPQSVPLSDPQPVPLSDPQSDPVSPAPPTVTVAIPDRIVGLSHAEISALFGKPQFRRRDAPAEIWQYRGTACTLDLFLYDTGEGFRVRHFEIRHPNAKPVSRRRCLAALVKARGSDLSG